MPLYKYISRWLLSLFLPLPQSILSKVMDAALPMTLSSMVMGVGLLLLTYFMYRAALPKPIPGIPYDKQAANRILGSVPDALRARQEDGVFSFLAAQIVKHNSPVVQVFMRPFGKPWVIISDFREAQDIMVRRTREFDRSAFFGDFIVPLLSDMHAALPTGDEWRAHRRLVADTMSAGFLQEVAGPQIYSSFLSTMDVWKEKMRLARGHPFKVSDDIFRGALDVIWAAAFGSEIGTSKTQLQLLSQLDSIDIPQDVDAAVAIPAARDPEAFEALITLTDSMEIPVNSPMPRLHHRFALRFFPTLAKAVKQKNDLISRHVEESWKRVLSKGSDGGHVGCALDLVLDREATLAKKEGRPAKYDTPVIQDELFGFLIAGHDTTSTTMCWGVKLLVGTSPSTCFSPKLELTLRRSP